MRLLDSCPVRRLDSDECDVRGVQSHSLSAPSIGSRWLDGVVDITPSTYAKVPATIDTLEQLMRIALFDFWIANEDRNANNANLM